MEARSSPNTLKTFAFTVACRAGDEASIPRSPYCLHSGEQRERMWLEEVPVGEWVALGHDSEALPGGWTGSDGGQKLASGRVDARSKPDAGTQGLGMVRPECLCRKDGRAVRCAELLQLILRPYREGEGVADLFVIKDECLTDTGRIRFLASWRRLADGGKKLPKAGRVETLMTDLALLILRSHLSSC